MLSVSQAWLHMHSHQRTTNSNSILTWTSNRARGRLVVAPVAKVCEAVVLVCLPVWCAEASRQTIVVAGRGYCKGRGTIRW